MVIAQNIAISYLAPINTPEHTHTIQYRKMYSSCSDFTVSPLREYDFFFPSLVADATGVHKNNE